MHPVSTVMHWSHHLHDGMTFMWHEVGEHLRSRHFWIGVAVTLLIIGFIALIVALSQLVPPDSMRMTQPYGFPFGM